VRPAQRFLASLALSRQLAARRGHGMMAGVLLDVLREASEQGGGMLPPTEFYNKASPHI
jgi:hypothetical protein